MRKIKAAIIGTGFIGPAHVEAVRRLGYVDMVGVCEKGDELAREKADQMHIEKAYGSVDALLADKEVEIVHNCTPNNLHFPITKKLLEAGKHVISEKPLSMTAAESRELVRLAKDKGVIHAINFNYRYYPLVQEARAMVAAGKLGDVFHATGSYTQDWLFLPTDWSWRLEPETSGESRAVADIGSHWLDCIQFVSGCRITRVHGHLHTIHKERMRPKKEVETYSGKVLTPEDYEPAKIGTEDYASVLLEFDNGAVGSFTVSQCFAGRKNRLFYELSGSKCSLVWDQEQPNELHIGYREKANEILLKDPSLLSDAARPFAHYPGGHPEAYPDGLKNFVAQVYADLLASRDPRPASRPAYSTFEDGHNEMAICEAVLESARRREWVEVAY